MIKCRYVVFGILVSCMMGMTASVHAANPSWLQSIIDTSTAIKGFLYWNELEKNYAGVGASDGTIDPLPDTSARFLTTAELSAKNDATPGMLYWDTDLKEYKIGQPSQTVADRTPNPSTNLTTAQIRAKTDGVRGLFYRNTETNDLYVARAHGGLASPGRPCPVAPIVTDADGNTYPTLKIGDQCWMGENLNVGTKIDDPGSFSAACSGNSGTVQTIGGIDCYCMSETDASCQRSGTGTNEKYCHSNNESNCDKYSGLYEWQEAMDLPANCAYTDCAAQIQTPHQGICPTGWHVPTDAEWKALEGYFGMTVAQQNAIGDWRGTDEGDQLKSIDKCAGDINCSTSGLSVPFAGYRGIRGGFNTVNSDASLWSASQYSSTHSWIRYLNSSHSAIYRVTRYKHSGYSLRCAKD